MARDPKNKRKYTSDQYDVKGSKKFKHIEPLEENVDASENDTQEGSNSSEEDENENYDISHDEVVSHATNSIKQPAYTELRTIREASELYRSNSFKLSIDSLLPNVRPKESRIKYLDAFLRKLYTNLTSPRSRPPNHPLEAARELLNDGISVPFPHPQPSQHSAWKVSFETPSDITLVGSWATKTIVKNSGPMPWTIDIAVEMPSTIFQEKDFLDYRFFYKRAYYLAVLAATLSADKELHADIYIDTQLSDIRLPSLLVIPRNESPDSDISKANAQIRIFPVLSQLNAISLRHLSPNHCNVRVNVMNNEELEITSKSPVSGTPNYNANILECISSRERLVRTYELSKEVPSFRDALSLLRVWANQRGYSPGPKEKGCIVGFERRGFFWTAIFHFLINGEEDFGQKTYYKSQRKVGKGLSSYQLFRAALDFLARHDFASEPIFIKDGSKFSPDKYETVRPVFIDFCSVNILAGVPLTSLDSLRHDARNTLDLLNSTDGSKLDTFDNLLLSNKRHLMNRFDVIISVDSKKVSLQKSGVELLDHGSHTAYALSMISSILRQALGDRVLAITIISPTCDPRPLSQQFISTSKLKIQIGLILDHRNAFRLVDHGPPASEEPSEEARAFRELWGDKSELRRFKDGRIIESVVWELKNIDERAQIPSEIVRYMLSRHFGIDVENDVRSFQSDFDRLLRISDSLVSHIVLPNAQPGFRNALTAFENLVRHLKGLEDDIPLAILNVSPASCDLRYTSTFTPIPYPLQNATSVASSTRYLPAMDLVLQFERSVRWPDDLLAIQKMKLAFFEQLSEALMKRIPDLWANVVISPRNNYSDTLITESQAYLEIITPEGWAFAIRIWHDREATLLSRVLDTKRSLVAIKPQHINHTSAIEVYRSYLVRYVHAPRHHRAVASLAHQFSAFSGTVRLVSRWLASHWILPQISHETIELICAFVFVGERQRQTVSDEHLLGVPTTKELGFFRVLAFLKNWSWESGLFVAVYDNEADNGAGSTENGNNQPNISFSGKGVWTISTSVDREGRVWTSDRPDALSARRIKMLASASIDYVLEHEFNDFVPRTLFLHPTDDYDVLIRLKDEVLCRTHQSLEKLPEGYRKERRYKNLLTSSPEDDEPLRVGFDPVLLYYNDLQRVFEGTIAFFYDPLGGGIIGGVWDPSLRSRRPFRVLADYSSKPSGPSGNEKKEKRKDEVELNTASVLAEIERLGEGLVSAIEVLR